MQYVKILIPALDDETLRLDEASGLAQILPIEVDGSLARYYRHIVTIFAEQQVDTAIVQFANLAIEAYATTEEGDSATKELWMKLFKAYSALELYEDAYMTLMAMPHADQ